MAYSHAERNLLAVDVLTRQAARLLRTLEATDPDLARQLRDIVDPPPPEEPDPPSTAGPGGSAERNAW